MQGLASLGVGQWLGAAGLVVTPPLVAWLEGKRSAWPLGFATFFLLFGLAHLLFAGDIVALWAALVLTAIIGIISKLKHRYLGFNFLAGDIYHLAASSFRSVLADHARMAVPALAAVIAIVLGIIVLALMLAEPAMPLPQRLALFSAAAFVYLCVFWASGGPKRFRFHHLTGDRFHLSAFVASWFGAGPSRRPGFVDIDPEPMPLLPPVPARRPAGERAPHIVMILHESTFDPKRLGMAANEAFERFFTPPDALSGALHVDVFGGSTLQTEFSVLTGLSSLSFGNDSRYVFHLLSGRVRHSLPSVLSGIGYNVSHISCDRPSFVNCGRFYQSVGFDQVSYAETLPQPFDVERWKRENHDEQLYDHALDQLSNRVAASKPCFLSITTLMNHGDHRRRIFPIERHAELRREAVAATGVPYYGEYTVRLAESVKAYAAFRRRLDIMLSGEPAIIVRYGDHQPSFTTALTGLPPSHMALCQTFYAIEAVNCRLPDDVVAPPVLDCAFLSTLTLLAAGLPLDPVFATRAALLNDCAAAYFDAASPRKDASIARLSTPAWSISLERLAAQERLRYTDGELQPGAPAMADYDPGNIFAKILRGEIPSHRVYEDDAVIAFMDVMPQGPGHTLVVPKAPSRNLLDAYPSTFGPLFTVVQKVALAVKKALDADGVTILQFNEPASGQTVYHLHVHVIPRFDGVPLKPHTGSMEKPEVLAENAEKIRAALGN